MRGAKVAVHPDFDYIVELIMRGKGARAIESIINAKYKNNRKYTLTWMTINDFIRNYLKMTGEDRQVLRKSLSKSPGQLSDKDLAIKSQLQQNIKILELKERVAEAQMDVQEEMESLHSLAMSEFDSLNARVKNMGDKDFVAGKQTIIGNLDLLRKILVDIGEMQRQHIAQEADDSSNNNVVIQFNQMGAYVDAMKKAVVETFRDAGMSQEVPKFLSKLSDKLSKLQSVEVTDKVGGHSITISDNSAAKSLNAGGGDG